MNSRSALTLGAAAALVAVSFGAVNAQGGAPSCEDPAAAGEVCVRFIGCVAQTGEVFDGRALGSGSGPLEATTTTARRCEGTWRILPGGLGGVASGFCQGGVDGDESGSAERTPFIAYYTYLDPVTGTAEADGFFGQSPLTALSGRAIPEFLRGRGAVDGAYQCGDETYPLS